MNKALVRVLLGTALVGLACATEAWSRDEVPQPAQGGTGCSSSKTIATLPGTPATGTMCFVTNGSAAAGDCSTTGTDKFLCIYNGASWITVGSATTITLSGDVSGSGTGAITTTIGADKVLESMLKISNSATVAYCLTSDGTTGFTWAACGGGNSFVTLTTSSGTSPVADNSSDTLTLTGTSPITVTGDSTTDTVVFDCPTCALNTAKKDKCMTVENPVAGDDFLFFRADAALTVTGIDCLVVGGTSAALLVKECDTSGGSCGNTEASITCGTTNTTESGGIDDSAVASANWMRVDPGTITGAVTQLAVCVEFTQP